MSKALPREQRTRVEQDQRDNLAALISEQVLHTLGTPAQLLVVQVRNLWPEHYRVNVLVGADIASARVAHSYFLVADGGGNITATTPPLTKKY
jgi:hypothetical protein